MNKSLVAQIRKKQGLTQEQLAEKCHLSTRTIQRLEVGKDTSMETLTMVANVLNVPISKLFEHIDMVERKENIMNITTDQVRQLRGRKNLQSLFKRITSLSFVVLMLVGGSFIKQSTGLVQDVSGISWIFGWAIGFSLIKMVRIFWFESYLDNKYPLTKGSDVMNFKQ